MTKAEKPAVDPRRRMDEAKARLRGRPAMGIMAGGSIGASSGGLTAERCAGAALSLSFKHWRYMLEAELPFVILVAGAALLSGLGLLSWYFSAAVCLAVLYAYNACKIWIRRRSYRRRFYNIIKELDGQTPDLKKPTQEEIDIMHDLYALSAACRLKANLRDKLHLFKSKLADRGVDVYRKEYDVHRTIDQFNFSHRTFDEMYAEAENIINIFSQEKDMTEVKQEEGINEAGAQQFSNEASGGSFVNEAGPGQYSNDTAGAAAINELSPEQFKNEAGDSPFHNDLPYPAAGPSGAGEHPDMVGGSVTSVPNTVGKTSELNFSQALELLKMGYIIARKGWNGKNMWLGIASEIGITGYAYKIIPLGKEGDIMPTCPCIFMRTADKRYVPWLASQTDILADDWEVLVTRTSEKE